MAPFSAGRSLVSTSAVVADLVARRCRPAAGALDRRSPARWPQGLGALQRRFVSSGKRDFFQRIDEQHLAHELRTIGAVARGLDPPPPFEPSIPAPLRRRASGAGTSSSSRRNRPVDEESQGGGQAGGADFPASGSGRSRPWLRYESLRGEAFPTGEGAGRFGPRWQDLTHAEAQRLQEMHMRKRMLDRKLQWLKMQDLPNPEREAKMTMRRQAQAESEVEAEEPVQMYPPPFMDTPHGDRKLQRMVEDAQLEELKSRFRNRIRQQKLENARIVKAPVPEVGDLTIDPIKRHVQRRLLRQRPKIHAGLEAVLTRNTAQILFEFLRGVAISIVRVHAQRPRQTQEIHYRLTSDHDPAWVQKQLDTLAPKLRSQLAVSVNMGQTPNIRFVPQVPSTERRKSVLFRWARALKNRTPAGGSARPGGGGGSG
eukprot:TRINITY_DN12596_c0_g1_i1.p1 TRINITY_DN12596_c0_g1~~TRINITY_DN12596_c0_g1_i1.p1  ORF type:complete len:448 (+),score=102.78 TRINITY_DN12596_c0_g1_i1:66-1346(+)